MSKPEFGSDLVVDVLRDYGIEYFAVNPGSSFRGLHESVVNHGGNKPEMILCHHEEIAVGLAIGYTKATGKIMAAGVHDVVGLQHASMAIFNAWTDRVPMLILGGTGPMDHTKRRPWIEWVHTALVQGNQVRDYVKWDDQPHSIPCIPESMIRGYRIAVTEPQGPVYICFDTEVQEGRIAEDIHIPRVTDYPLPTQPAASDAVLEEVANLLARADRPVIVADYVGSHDDGMANLVLLAESIGAAVIDKGGSLNFPTNHPLESTYASEQVLRDADVVLALELEDPWGGTLGIQPGAKLIVMGTGDVGIHAWSATYQRLVPCTLEVTCAAPTALPRLVELTRRALQENSDAQQAVARRFDRIGKIHEATRAEALATAEAAWDDTPISYPRLFLEVWNAIKEENWVLAQRPAGDWSGRLWDFTKPRQFIGFNKGGGLGYGLSAALGAGLAYKGTDTVVVNMQPDGDSLFVASGFWTAAHHRLPLLTIMVNNRAYQNSVAHQTKLSGYRGRDVSTAGEGTDITDPNIDFAQLARAQGVWAEGPVEDPAEIGPAIRRAMAVVKQGLPAVVDVVTARR